MSNALTATAATAIWTTKAGKVQTRLSALGAMAAPKAVQVSAAMECDLQKWESGQFRPIVADIRRMLTTAQALQVAEAASLNPTKKADVLTFLSACVEAMSMNAKGEPVTPKGEKARFVSLIGAIEAYECERETLRLETEALEALEALETEALEA